MHGGGEMARTLIICFIYHALKPNQPPLHFRLKWKVMCENSNATNSRLLSPACNTIMCAVTDSRIA